MSKQKDSFALISVEAEYIAASEVGKEVVWFMKLFGL